MRRTVDAGRDRQPNGVIDRDDHEKAQQPEDLTRLFVERANAGDADGIAALYEPDAVMAYPPGSQTVGRDAIRALWEEVLPHAPALRAGGTRCPR